ncbi:MAG TPA: glycosyltransferase family 2 protein, partial [Steroidobacteraceae bacterium]|nr:glycosyltransferase family 2 protein [Steroidobacteraceae bacterium]
AVVVIDADSAPSPNLLEACAARLQQGAQAVQADYRVLNLEAAWRTRLMAIAMGAFHAARSRARERLGLSCGIRGNGWCITHALLRQVPYQAFSIVEDLEYGIDLGLAGQRVHYADEAWVKGEMVTGARAARSQRRRWEQGRFALIRARALPLLAAAVRRRSKVCLDLALDLLVLPLSNIALGVAVITAVATADAMLNGSAHGLWLAGFCAAGVACYVLRGWQLSGTGARGLLDLGAAPVFIVWKTALLLTTVRPGQWIRTQREDP